jgi:hypothetical protein
LKEVTSEAVALRSKIEKGKKILKFKIQVNEAITSAGTLALDRVFK